MMRARPACIGAVIDAEQLVGLDQRPAWDDPHRRRLARLRSDLRTWEREIARAETAMLEAHEARAKALRFAGEVREEIRKAEGEVSGV